MVCNDFRDLIDLTGMRLEANRPLIHSHSCRPWLDRGLPGQDQDGLLNPIHGSQRVRRIDCI